MSFDAESPTPPNAMTPNVSTYKPERSGAQFSWGIVLIIVAQFLMGIAVMLIAFGRGSERGAIAPLFLFAFIIGGIGVALVLSAFNRLSKNIEYLAMTEHLRQGNSATTHNNG